MATPSYGKRPSLPFQPNGVPPDDGDFIRSAVKLADLPITSAQRNAIDGLVHTFKRKGEFDKLRKSIYAEFTQSVRQTSAICNWASNLTMFRMRIVL
jgi:hypothetical protein